MISVSPLKTLKSTIGQKVEYGIGFNSKRELVVIEFNRTTGETRYIPLVVVDGKVVMAAEEGE